MPADTNSPLLGLLLQGTGNNDNTWGENLNNLVFTYLENAIAGRTSIGTAGGTITLTAAENRSAFLDFSGTLTSSAVVVVESHAKIWQVRNGTNGFSLGMKTSGGTIAYIPQGGFNTVLCDGTTVYSASSHNNLVQAGTVFDTAWLIPAAGHYECDGSTKLRAVDVDLFAAISVSPTGFRTNGNISILNMSSVNGIQAGMPVCGTGIPSGAVVTAVTSSTSIQILPAPTSTGGPDPVIVCPWGVGDGSTTFPIPNLYTDGKFRRSRSNSVAVGTYQTDDNKSHLHTATGTATSTVTATTDSQGAHDHTGSTGTMSANHNHVTQFQQRLMSLEADEGQDRVLLHDLDGGDGLVNFTSGNPSGDHLHSIPTAGAHTHTITASATTTITGITIATSGGTEARPKNASFMTVIKR